MSFINFRTVLPKKNGQSVFGTSTARTKKVLMKHYVLVAIATCMSLGAFAIDYDDFARNMGVVSVWTSSQNALTEKKVFVAKPAQEITPDEWEAYRKCITFCLIDAGYDVVQSAKGADMTVQTEWAKDTSVVERSDETIATYNICIRLQPTKSNNKPLVYTARTIISPDGGIKSALTYTCAALLDNVALNNPHQIDFWISLDDVAFNELPSVMAMKFLAE